MPRTIILLLDSFGIGATEDADKYGDAAADTFGHIAESCANNQANINNGRQGPLHIPNFLRLGLAHAAEASRKKKLPFAMLPSNPEAAWGYACEKSFGKDTPSGHWEIAGVPVLFDWGYFPPEYPSFPQDLLDDFIAAAKIPGILGNKHASGTDIIQELGAEHMKTGKPIVYTSADSVFQIAAHEHSFGLEKLYDICEIARKLVDPYKIGRVIARPFLGEPGNFYRTGNRRDISIPPPEPTLLDHLVANNRPVIAIGKIADIYAHQGISKAIKADGNQALFTATLDAMKIYLDNCLIFTNFVDFDMLYGHRRDISGYASALEALDARLPELEALLQKDDLVIVTADHGCDPTMPGSDHTREYIPVLAFGQKITPKNLGKRETFADIGQSIAKHMGIPALSRGTSFL